MPHDPVDFMASADRHQQPTSAAILSLRPRLQAAGGPAESLRHRNSSHQWCADCGGDLTLVRVIDQHDRVLHAKTLPSIPPATSTADDPQQVSLVPRSSTHILGLLFPDTASPVAAAGPRRPGQPTD